MAYFSMSLDKVELPAGGHGQLEVEYVGPENRLIHGYDMNVLFFYANRVIQM